MKIYKLNAIQVQNDEIIIFYLFFKFYEKLKIFLPHK